MTRLLSRVAVAMRAQRSLTPATHGHTLMSLEGQRHLYAFLCFRSRGCRFDYVGQCAMCEYWRSAPPTPEQMVAAVAEALARLTVIPETLQVTPSGSMFDPWEVPEEVQEAIFALIAPLPCRRFICESRPEFVTAGALRRLRAALGDKDLGVEIGLESASPFVLEFCLNKTAASARFLARHGSAGSDFGVVFRHAVETARAQGVSVYANILLGAPFLTPEEAIRDAVASVSWALDVGAAKTILFPSHVKPHTVTHALWRQGLYQPPSLWSLVEVLWRLGPERARDCFISWYRPQYTETHRRLGKGSDAWPTTCPACEARVLASLDAYRGTEGFEHVAALHRLTCACKDRWRDSLVAPAGPGLRDRVLSGHAVLARDWLKPPQAAALWPETEARIREAVLPPFAQATWSGAAFAC